MAGVCCACSTSKEMSNGWKKKSKKTRNALFARKQTAKSRDREREISHSLLTAVCNKKKPVTVIECAVCVKLQTWRASKFISLSSSYPLKCWCAPKWDTRSLVPGNTFRAIFGIELACASALTPQHYTRPSHSYWAVTHTHIRVNRSSARNVQQYTGK